MELAACDWISVIVVDLCAVSGVDVGLVGVAAAGQCDVGHGAAGSFSDDGVGGVGGDALGGVHGDRVPQRDVLAQIVVVEDDAGVVGESFGRNAIRSGVDGGDAPAVAVADLIHHVTTAVAGARLNGDGGIIASADDEIPDPELLFPCGLG